MTFSSKSCLRLNASNCRVRVAARSAACWIDCTSWCMWLPFSSCSSSTSVYPVITISRLLKSCATPPANRPTASIFCACRSCSSNCLRSVMSSAISSNTSSGSSLAVAAQPLSRTMMMRPSLRRHCTSTPFRVPLRRYSSASRSNSRGLTKTSLRASSWSISSTDPWPSMAMSAGLTSRNFPLTVQRQMPNTALKINDRDRASDRRRASS